MIRIVSVQTDKGTKYAIQYSFLGIYKSYKDVYIIGTWWNKHLIHHALYPDLKSCYSAYLEYKNIHIKPVSVSELEKVIYDP